MSKLNLGQLHVDVTVVLLVIFSSVSLPLRHCASFRHLSPAHLLLLFLILPSSGVGVSKSSISSNFKEAPLEILFIVGTVGLCEGGGLFAVHSTSVS